MSEKNSFGLDRYIPADVRRKVRQRCGFGCVVCGSAIVDYEHFDPEFKDAESHEARGIILLCPTHHRAKGGFIGHKTLAAAAENPYCISKRIAWAKLHLDQATVDIGPFTVEHCEIVLRLHGENIIWFNQPEESGAPSRLNLRLYDKANFLFVSIEDNVWITSPESTDAVLISGNVQGVIRVDDKKGVVFEAHVRPPDFIRVVTFRGWKNGEFFELQRKSDEDGKFIRNGRTILSGNVRAGHSYAAVVV